MEMGGKSGTAQVRHISEAEREHGVRKITGRAVEGARPRAVHRLRAGRRAALCLRRRGRAWRRHRAAGRARSRRRSARDVLLRGAAARPARIACRTQPFGAPRDAWRRADAMATSSSLGDGRPRALARGKTLAASIGAWCCCWRLVAGDRLRRCSIPPPTAAGSPGPAKQAMRFGVAAAIMVVAALVDLRIWLRIAYWFYAVVMAAAGRGRDRAARSAWARSAGSISASSRSQPSEMMKIAAGAGAGALFPRPSTVEEIGRPALPRSCRR